MPSQNKSTMRQAPALFLFAASLVAFSLLCTPVCAYADEDLASQALEETVVAVVAADEETASAADGADTQEVAAASDDVASVESSTEASESATASDAAETDSAATATAEADDNTTDSPTTTSDAAEVTDATYLADTAAGTADTDAQDAASMTEADGTTSEATTETTGETLAEDAVTEDGAGDTTTEGDAVDEAVLTTDEATAATATETEVTAQATGSLPAAPAGATTSAVINGKVYVIQSLLAVNRVAGTAKYTAKSGTNVTLAGYIKRSGQKWVVKREGTSKWYRLLLYGSNKKLALGVSGSNVLIVKNPTSSSGLLKVLWSFVSTGSGTYRLVNATNTKKSLDVTGSSTKAGANLRIYTTSSSSPKNQKFRMVQLNPTISKSTKSLTGSFTISASALASLKVGVKSFSRAQNAVITLQGASSNCTQQIYLQPDGKGYYIAWVVGSGRALTVSGASILPGSKVVQRAYQAAAHQKWAVVATKNSDGTYTATLQNKGTGLVLGASTAKSGTWVTGQLKSGSNTKFTLTKRSLLTAGITCITPLATSSTAVSIPSAATGTSKVNLWTNSGALNQRFELQSVGSNLWRIRTASSGGWITWKSGSTVRQEGSSSTAVSKANTWKAIWKNGGISLINQASGKALQMSYGKTVKGTNIVAGKSTGAKSQHFVYTPASLIKNGTYLVNSKWSGKRLSVDEGSTAPANISNASYGSTAQSYEKFAFTKVGSGYTITNVKSGLKVTGGGYADNDGYANVSQKRTTGANNQLWKAQIGDGGYVEFVNVASGKYLVSRNANSETSDGIWPAYNVVERNASEKSSYTTGCSWKLASTSGTPNSSPVTGTTVLLIGNSFTMRNNLYKTLQSNLGSGAYVNKATQGSTTLLEHYDPTAGEPDLAYETLKKIYFGDWDAIVLQEQSTTPIDYLSTYVASLKLFVNLSKKVGAVPIIYGTWAYPGGTGGAEDRGITCAAMHSLLQEAFAEASSATGATIADVGSAFAERDYAATLYEDDSKHPSAYGSSLAASVIAETIQALV